MSDQPNTGPSPETLANLKAMLPSFIKGLAKKKILGKGIQAQVRRPRKCCKVCGLLFDYTFLSPSAELEIKPDLCKTCGPMLKEGYTALVCGEKYAIVKSPAFESWAGEIIRISPHVMEAVEKQAGIAKLKINGSQKPTDPS